MSIKFSTTARNVMLDGIAATVGSGGILRIYSGPIPNSATAALDPTNKVLAELALSSPPAPAASGGVLVFSPITRDVSANDTGVATFFRVFRSGGLESIFQGSVGLTTQDMVVNNTTISAGAPVQITNFQITAPGE